MDRLAAAAAAVCAALLAAAAAAHAQEGAGAGEGGLEIRLDNDLPYDVGSGPQELTVSVVHGGLPAAGARLYLELPGAPEGVYCTCGQAAANATGMLGIRWSSPEAGAYTLRITASAGGLAEAAAEFVLLAAGPGGGAAGGARASMWIPPSMLEGGAYEGIIITERSYEQGASISLTTDRPSSVRVGRAAAILPGENHAIFPIYPLAAEPGGVGIFASVDGPLVSAESRVYSQQNVPSQLRVVFAANSTMTDRVATYVFVVDANGDPAHAGSDTDVLLEAGPALDPPHSVVIREGSFYARFETGVFGSGELVAHADGLGSGSAAIEKTSAGPVLRLGIAPQPAGAHSHAKYYAWLELDGRPYSPPGVMVGHLYTNDTGVAGFGPSGRGGHGSETIYMRGGLANGTVYTRAAGAASITASFPDVGTAASDLVVGPGIAADGSIRPAGGCAPAPERPGGAANAVRAWVYPELTSGPALLTVAPYYRADADAGCADGPGEGAGECGEGGAACATVWHPAELDGRQASLSVMPPGAVYDKTVTLAARLLKSFAAEFELDARDVGDYVLDVTTTNVHTASADFSMRARHAEEYALRVTPLLAAQADEPQEIALVSIVNSKGSMVDVGQAFGRPQRISVSVDGQPVGAIISAGSAPVRAAIGATAEVTASAPGLARGSATVAVPGAPAGIVLDIPDRVHLHEEFPFAMHEADSRGIPVRQAEGIEIVAGGIDTDWESRRMRAGLTGNVTMSVLADHGAHQESVSVFANTLGLDVRVSGAAARVGTPFLIDIVPSARPADIAVSTSVPWSRVEGSESIRVASEVPGRFPVTITASKRGYAPASETVHVIVEDYARIRVSAAGTDGAELGIAGVRLVTSTRDSEETESGITLPWRREYGNLASATVLFPQTHEAGGGYVYSGAQVNGREYAQSDVHFSVSGDTDIRATYERSVTIGVRNGDAVRGAGAYPFGAQVELVAGPKERLAFLIVEVFEGWEDVPDGAQADGPVLRLVADADHDIAAVYREDHSGLLAVVLAGMISAAGYGYYARRSPAALSWTAGEILGAVRARVPLRARRPSRPGRDDSGEPAPQN